MINFPLVAKRPNTQEPVTSGRKKKKTDNTRQLITNFFATKQTPASVPAAASTDDNSPGSELSHEMQCLNEQVQASMEETTTNEEPSEQERVSTEEQIATEEPLNDQILMQDTEESPSGAENQHCNLQNRPNYNDIGFILNATMSAEDAINAISNLSDQEKYKLLKRHFIPPPSYTFRPRLQYGISRKCPKEFNRSYPWLVYSDNLDGVFCIHCALFAKDRLQLNEIVNAPFNNWSKFKRKMDTHGKALYHRDALDDSKAFEAKMEQPNTTLPRIVNKELKQRAHDNEQILRHIISAVLFCAKQCIGLRGTNESIENITSNPGNFLAFLKVKSEDDEVLKNHLDNPKHRNVTYISPQIQNELIEVMGDIVSRSLVKELIEAGYYTIMADEVTSHNKEYMPLCVRFVDNERNIREEFLEFVQVERITGQYLATTIKSVLNRHHIPLHLMRGQCYDGAANMSSDRCGVQKYVMEESPMAPYTRCNSHALNLVIVHACKNTHISHTLTKMKEICMFFKYSPKRAGLLESIIKQGAPSAERRKPMLDLCKTRWAERHHAYEHFYDAYVFIVEALEFISHGLHKQKYDLNVFDGTWDATSRKDACSLLHAITDFGFITVFMVLYQGLGALSGISVQLQQKALDVYDAFSKVSNG